MTDRRHQLSAYQYSKFSNCLITFYVVTKLLNPYISDQPSRFRCTRYTEFNLVFYVQFICQVLWSIDFMFVLAVA